MRRHAVALISVSLCACLDVQPAALYCASEPAPAASTKPGITYHRDIEPLINAKCAGCHSESGIGPFPLTNWAEVKPHIDQIFAEVVSRRMPPWPPAPCCHEYLHPLALSEDHIAAIRGWVDQGSNEGAPTQVTPYARQGLERIDVEAVMPEPYLPAPGNGATDETRCFLLDWSPEGTTSVRGIDIHPGARAQMHHGLVFLVSKDDATALQKIDDAAPGPGWPCPGGIVSHMKSGLGGALQEPQLYADGTGVEVAPGERLVLSMHYSQPPIGPFVADRTTVQLLTQTEPVTPVVYVMVFSPSWVIGGMPIPKGQSSVMHRYTDEPTLYNGGRPYLIYAVNLHMHERGQRGQVTILRANGERECLLQIDAWDYGHQGDYQLVTPVRLAPKDRVLVECEWDNSTAHQRLRNGVPEASRDLNWGESEEMCIAFLTTTLAPATER